MNSKVLVLVFGDISNTLYKHLSNALTDTPYEFYEEGMSCKSRKILCVSELNSIGYDIELLTWLNQQASDAFEGSTGAMIIKSPSDLFTKSFAQDVLFIMNQKQMAFIGHSVVEIIADYKNFHTWQEATHQPLHELCNLQCRTIVERLTTFKVPVVKKVLALHASSYKTSNTLGLWHLINKKIEEDKCKIKSIHIENGTVVDCKGCPFQTCMYYGESRSCFYGGIMVEEVLPAIEESDLVVWVCPNYNDAVSANLLAVINRLTVLYRQITFHNKLFYAVVVSGNSGSDSVAKQLIGALNVNKGFYLPPDFCTMAIANAPLKVLDIEDIDDKAKYMANQIMNYCKK